MGQRFKALFESDQDFYDKVVADAEIAFQADYGCQFRTVNNEDSRFMKVCGWIQKNIFRNADWFDNVSMTWWWSWLLWHGKATIYMPKNLRGTAGGALKILHECEHLRQYHKYTTLGFLVAYFCLLPFGLTLRKKMEVSAFSVQLAATVAYLGLGAARTLSNNVLDALTNSRYIWATFWKSKLQAELLQICLEAAKKDAQIEADLAQKEFTQLQLEQRFWQKPDRDLTPMGNA